MIAEIFPYLEESFPKISAPCPVFGHCGGCDFQDIAYEHELKIKELSLRDFLQKTCNLSDVLIEPIVASPKAYGYRHRLDLKLQKTIDSILIGFSPKSGHATVVIEECAIARQSISGFIPHVKQEALAKMTPKYRQANLVVKTDDSDRVLWGGMGKGSLTLLEKDYLWTEIAGKKIYYSLDTFFQANLFILPQLIEKIRALNIWEDKPHFFDLYGGVGLFTIGLSDLASQITLIESDVHSIKLAKFNKAFHNLNHFTIIEGSVEEKLSQEEMKSLKNCVGMIDPPRSGLSQQAKDVLLVNSMFQHFLYLSCNPSALARDLKDFMAHGWLVEKIIPFDFFPRTRHLETLAVLRKI